MNSNKKHPEENDITSQSLSKRSRLKKKIIIVIISIFALMILMFISIFVLSTVLDKISGKDEEYDFNFYEADYNENIFEDREYLSLIENGYISYCDMDNVTLGIDEDDAHKYGQDVEFIVSYIQHMINGDVDKYNSCYSELYYEEEDPKEKFTMQKIYDVLIKMNPDSSEEDFMKQVIHYLTLINK